MNVPVITVKRFFKNSMMDELADSSAFPILWYHPNFGLLVSCWQLRAHFSASRKLNSSA